MVLRLIKSQKCLGFAQINFYIIYFVDNLSNNMDRINCFVVHWYTEQVKHVHNLIGHKIIITHNILLEEFVSNLDAPMSYGY